MTGEREAGEEAQGVRGVCAHCDDAIVHTCASGRSSRGTTSIRKSSNMSQKVPPNPCGNAAEHARSRCVENHRAGHDAPSMDSSCWREPAQ
jgi:hypothetical protein